MYVVVLMAGAGSRFANVAHKNKAYLLPKPMIPVLGKPILEWTTRSLPFIRHNNESVTEALPASKCIFSIRTQDEEQHSISSTLRKMYGEDIKIISFPKLTRGNLETAFISCEGLNENEELLILDSDNAYDGSHFVDELKRLKKLPLPPAAMICCFEPLDDAFKWCFGMLEKSGRVKGLMEKDPKALTLGGKPMIGTFYFSSVGLFRKSAQEVMNSGAKTGFTGKEEVYLSQGVQNLITQGASVYAHIVANVAPMGTPEDVEYFISKNQTKQVNDANLH